MCNKYKTQLVTYITNFKAIICKIKKKLPNKNEIQMFASKDYQFLNKHF